LKFSIESNISQKEKSYKRIKQAIISYEIKPGEPLVEEQIADKLGVSRTPVREALKELKSEGLVKIIPRKGAFVAEISSRDIEEIFLLREILECAAIKIAISRIKEEDLIEIESTFNSFNDDTKKKNYENILYVDIKFHNFIVDSSGNRRLCQFIGILNDQVYRLRYLSATAPGRLGKSLQEHIGILEALKKRDKDLAVQRLRQHIRDVKNNILARLYDK
jgi:DNA-binding GntR family transcriptional regulator